ncbi:MAG TPA: hypothetical protein VFH72_03975 [Candidatus Baltobacteraceae bacterium]|jgi:hypothetical protein|nr:hypothetical protein [Candidatus Baltobacteraceae bacterium]
MNEDIELTQEDRLNDLTSAYVTLRNTLSAGTIDTEKASALAQLSIAISLLEREAYSESEGEYEEEEDDEEEDDDEEV